MTTKIIKLDKLIQYEPKNTINDLNIEIIGDCIKDEGIF